MNKIHSKKYLVAVLAVLLRIKRKGIWRQVQSEFLTASFCRLYLLQIFILFQHGAFIPDIPIVAAAAAERFGLCADKPCVHDLGEVMIGPAEIRKQLIVAVRLRVLCYRAPDKVKSKALSAARG